MPEDNKQEIKMNNMKMVDLTNKEQVGVIYSAGIKTLKEKIEDNNKLLFKLCTIEEDNVIFSTLFFLFVILTGNDNEVKNTILKCKQEELEDKKLDINAINDYIDMFNVRIKELSKIYLEENAKSGEDLEFQNNLIYSFSTYMMNNLKIEINDDAYDELKFIHLSALKIAFGFKDKNINEK